MKIRPAIATDLKYIKSLIAKYPRQLIQTNLPKRKDFFVAEDKGKVIACCALEVYSKRMAEVRSLVVDSDYQRRLIATKLIKRCLKRAGELGVYEVLSITSTVPLFEKQGFKTFNNEKYALLKIMKG